MNDLLLILNRLEKSRKNGRKVLSELERHGVKLSGFIARGYRGIVFEGTFKGKAVAVKVRRSRAKAEKTLKECRILQYLERFSQSTGEANPAPAVYLCTGEFIVMELVSGRPLRATMEEQPLPASLSAIRACYFLDRAGVKHSEIKGEKHLLFDGERVRIIDYDTATFSEKPRNVLQFIGYHLIGKPHLLRQIGVSKAELLSATKVYKEDREKGFKLITALLERKGEGFSPHPERIMT